MTVRVSATAWLVPVVVCAATVTVLVWLVGFVVVVVAPPPHPTAPKLIATAKRATKERALRKALRRLMERKTTIGSRAKSGAFDGKP